MSFRLRRRPRATKVARIQSTTKDAFTHGDSALDSSSRARSSRLRLLPLDQHPAQQRQRHYREPIPEAPTIQPTCFEIKILLGPQARESQQIEDGILDRDLVAARRGRQKHIRPRVSASSAPEASAYAPHQFQSQSHARSPTRATLSHSHSLLADNTGRVRRVVRRRKSARPSSALRGEKGRQSTHRIPRAPYHSPFQKEGTGFSSHDTPSAIPWISPSDQLRAYCAASGLYGMELYGGGLDTVGESPLGTAKGAQIPEPHTSRYGSLYGGAINPGGDIDSSVASPYKPTPSSRNFPSSSRNFPGPFGKSKFSPSPFSAPAPSQAKASAASPLRPLKTTKMGPTGVGMSFPSEPARFRGFDSKPCSPPDVTPTWRSPQNTHRAGAGAGTGAGAGGGGGLGVSGARGLGAGGGERVGAGGGRGRGVPVSTRQPGVSVADSLVGRMLVDRGESTPVKPMGPSVQMTAADGMVGMFASQSRDGGSSRKGNRGAWGAKKAPYGMGMGSSSVNVSVGVEGGMGGGRMMVASSSSRLQEQLARVEAKDRSLGLRRFDTDSTQLTNQRSTEFNGSQHWTAPGNANPGATMSSAGLHEASGLNASSNRNPPLAGADSYDFGAGQNLNAARPPQGMGRYEAPFSAATSAPESPSVAGSRRSTHPYISAQAQSSADKVMSWQDAFVLGPGNAPGSHSPLREGLVEEEELEDSTSSDSDIMLPPGQPQGVPRGQALHKGPSHGALDVSAPAMPMQVSSSAENSFVDPPRAEKGGRRGGAVPKFGEWRARGLTRTFSSRFEGLREQRQKAGVGTMAAGG